MWTLIIILVIASTLIGIAGTVYLAVKLFERMSDKYGN